MPVCAVVLAAGEGTRLRPLTTYRPKALCPVANVPLLDRVLHRLGNLGLAGPERVAVNACSLADQIVDAVGERAHLSVEAPPALGTSGGVANLRDWTAGRAVLACNADAYLSADQPIDILTGWDGGTVRVLVVPGRAGEGEFGGHRQWRFAGMSLLPSSVVRELPRRAGALVSTVWRPAEARGDLELVPFPGVYLDCGTPADYLAANLHASGGGNVVGRGAAIDGTLTNSVVGDAATVRGTLTRSVVWPGGHVDPGEHLVEVIRVGRGVTVPARG